MGVMRWRSALDSEIATVSAQRFEKLDIEILTAIRLALYQLRWLDRIPARAAIHESVELVKRARKRSAAPFVNAVLRKLSSGASANLTCSHPALDSDSTEALANRSAHPLWLVQRWVREYGLSAAQRICEYDQSVPVTAIRLRRPDADTQLEHEAITLDPGALLSSARRVRRGDISHTNALRSGACVIQDEASQLIAALVGQGTQVLDCCAAPGGKTLAIADRNRNATLTAVELHPHRARLLKRLMTFDGGSERQAVEIRVIAADARKLPFAAEFDRVLADVPCSGTGTLARNPEIKWKLTSEDLKLLQMRQIAILRSTMAQVADGGRLIYSTCSLEREENEHVIELCVEENPVFRVIDCQDELEKLEREGDLTWPNRSSLLRGPFLRTLPGIHPCDGFFAAILEKI